MRLISISRAYALASKWGSYNDATDPGTCMYAFILNDGRPISEVHRILCLRWLRTRRADTAKDERELQQLIRFMANAPLRPEARP